MKRLLRLIAVAPLSWCAWGWAQSPPEPGAADQWLTRPVDDRTFRTYLEFFTYDRRLPLEVRVTASEQEEDGIQRERLSFQSTAGVRVTAVYYRLPAAAAKIPAVIYLHGGGASGKDSPGSKVLAELLTRAGWNVLAIDLQHFGERAAGLFTTFTDPEKHERLYNQPSTYLAWITQAVKDISRSYDFLVDERGVDPKRIALVGHSRGAIVGTIAGGAERRLAAVALLYGAHFDALERGHLPAACPANYIGRISPRPLFMVNGTQDTDMIKETQVEPFQRLARTPKLILWADTGHRLPTEEHRAAMVQWLRESVK
jgi:dipeptidyl aminopeptidase/acylaminoacyl peptidase